MMRRKKRKHKPVEIAVSTRPIIYRRRRGCEQVPISYYKRSTNLEYGEWIRRYYAGVVLVATIAKHHHMAYGTFNVKMSSIPGGGKWFDKLTRAERFIREELTRLPK